MKKVCGVPMSANDGVVAGAYEPGKSSRTPGRREVINVQGVGRIKWGERGIYISCWRCREVWIYEANSSKRGSEQEGYEV